MLCYRLSWLHNLAFDPTLSSHTSYFCYLSSHLCVWLQILVDECVPAGVRDSEGMTPAMWACRFDRVSHFDVLTNCRNVTKKQQMQDHSLGADDDVYMHEHDMLGRTCLHWSIRRVEPLDCLKVCFCHVDSVFAGHLHMMALCVYVCASVCLSAHNSGMGRAIVSSFSAMLQGIHRMVLSTKNLGVVGRGQCSSRTGYSEVQNYQLTLIIDLSLRKLLFNPNDSHASRHPWSSMS